MINRPLRFTYLLLPLALIGIATARLAPAPVGFTRLDKKPGTRAEAIQTRAVRYVPTNGKGPIVWLVGVAHIGEANYYKQIEKLLNAQSLVLFEGVQRGGEQKDVDLSSTYKLFASAVGLTFQLNTINYKKPSFKNSDLAWEDLEALAKKGGKEGQAGLDSLSSALDANSAQGKQLTMFLNMIKNDPGSQEAMRVVLAEALSNPTMITKVMGPLQSDIIIRARNDKVFGDLQNVVSSPAPIKSVAIFYGAAHMPDLDHRMTTTLGYKMTEERWFSAINADESKATGQGATILSMFRGMMGKG